MVDVNRRSFLKGFGALTLAAPVIVRSTSLMPIRGLILPRYSIVTPEMFGAVGDGIIDDTKAFQDAIDWVSKLGGGEILSSNTYLISRTLTVDLNETTKLLGGNLEFKGNLDYAIKVNSSEGSDKTITFENIILNVEPVNSIILKGYV